MRNILIIPARGGSIGIPDKNLYELRNQSLVYRAVRASLASELGEVIVSSDSKRILMEGEIAGASRLIKRPDELANSKSKTIETIVHVLSIIEYDPDFIFIVQPTTPLRQVSDLIDSYKIMRMKPDAISLASITKQEEPHPYKMFTKTQEYLKPLIRIDNVENPRQELDNIYRLNGGVYILKTEAIEQKRVISDYTTYYEMPPQRSINIDTPWDLVLLEALLSKSDVELFDY